MNFLFIDLETNGLNPNVDNVLEIGGILANFDPRTFLFSYLDSFQSLIQPRQPLNLTSSRITGLTDIDFALAPKLFQVQELWYKWLEKNDLTTTQVILVGHSILDFDLKFLHQENWFLPEKYQVIDTMPLAKILFPQYQAINLEYLCSALGLETTIKSETTRLNLDSKAHRALYDCFCGFELLRKSLELLEKYKLPNIINKLLAKHYLPFDLNKLFLSSQSNTQTLLNKSNPKTELSVSEQKVNWALEPSNIKLTQKIADLDQSKIIELLEDYSHQFSVALLQVTLQIATLSYLSKYFLASQLHFHGRIQDFTHAQLFIDQVQNKALSLDPLPVPEQLKEQLDSQVNGQTMKPLELPLFEELMWQISDVSEKRIKLFPIIILLEELINGQYLLNSTTMIAIQKVISSYDFLVLNMHSFWQYNQYSYQPDKMTLVEDQIFRKFESFCSSLAGLIQHLNNTAFENQFVSFIKDKTLKILANFGEFNPNYKYKFNLVKDYLEISRIKEGFLLQDYLLKTLETNSELIIPTFATSEELTTWCELFGINSSIIKARLLIKESSYNPNIFYYNEPKYDELIDQIISQEDCLANLILCGDNRTLKSFEKICFDNLATNQYLVLGESGSKTKIISKLASDFRGVVVLKQSDFGFLLNFQSKLNFANIYFVNKPYLIANDYWKEKWGISYSANLKTTTYLYLQIRIRRAKALLTDNPAI